MKYLREAQTGLCESTPETFEMLAGFSWNAWRLLSFLSDVYHRIISENSARDRCHLDSENSVNYRYAKVIAQHLRSIAVIFVVDQMANDDTTPHACSDLYSKV